MDEWHFSHAVDWTWNYLMVPVVQWHHLLCRENLRTEDGWFVFMNSRFIKPKYFFTMPLHLGIFFKNFKLIKPKDNFTMPLHLGQHFSPSFPWIRWVVTFASSKNRGFELRIQIETKKKNFWFVSIRCYKDEFVCMSLEVLISPSPLSFVADPTEDLVIRPVTHAEIYHSVMKKLASKIR